MGNLIILGICCLIVFAVRYMDRHNRSVDLAREYGKRLKEDIADFAEEKAAEVKDYGVELEVQKSSAKELLNRLGSSRTALADQAEAVVRRIEEVARIGDRISAYDKSMGELIRLSARVEENMGRLRSESAFADQTAKKISQTRASLEELEKTMGSLARRFQQENAEALEKTAEALTARVSSTVEDLQAEAEAAERRAAEHREAVERIEAERGERIERDLELIDKTLAGAIDRAAVRSEQLEEAALTKAREAAMERVNHFKEAVERQILECEENAETGMGETRALIGVFKDEWRRQQEEIWAKERELYGTLAAAREDLEAKQQELQRLFEAEQEEFRLARQQNLEALEAKQNEFSGRISEEQEERRLAWQGDLRELEAKQQEFHENLETWQKEYRLAWHRDREGFELRQREYQLTWQRDIEALDALALSQRKQWEAATAEAEQRIAALESELGRKTSEAEETILRELERRLSLYREDQENQWERFDAVAGDALKLDALLRTSMEEAELRVRREFAAFEELQREEGTKAQAAFARSADIFRTEMTALEQDLNTLKNRAYENVSEKLRIFEDDFFTDLTRRGTEIDSRLVQWQADLDRKLLALGEEAESERRVIEHSYRDGLNKGLDEQREKLRSELERLRRESEIFEERIQNGLDETESRISQLSLNADEIRRQLKEFSSQTRIFEKTDELKTALERSLETLKGDLTGIEERRAEAAQLETEFIKIRRLEDEVNAKMTRFLAEKNHLDVMERDFTRLIQTSQRVEERLKEVTGADDTLQGMQITLRKLEDSIAAAEDRYFRLEKKNQVLEETNTSIERNFRLLEETEAALKKCHEDIDRTEEEVDSLRPSIEKLAAANGRAEAAADKLGLLDSGLAAIEERIEKMQTAREWLARAETRFEEINQQAQDQLKLLEAVLKNEGRTSKSKTGDASGAPPAAVRENVRRLARQGWGADEIARSLKISRSEVELILELEPRE
jgi:uncharacterized phage infection (PIP) family protein YhgE